MSGLKALTLRLAQHRLSADYPMILSVLRSLRITEVRNIRVKEKEALIAPARILTLLPTAAHLRHHIPAKKPLSRKTTPKKPRTMQIMQSPLLKKPQRLLLR